MAGHWVPRTPDREERIFGGILSLRQAVYLLGALLAVAGVQAVVPLPGHGAGGLILRLLLAALVALPGLLLAFGRLARYELNLDEALLRWWRWRSTPRRYVFRRLP